ncbi:hypothetical protein [Fodinicurvata sp. EGI_FJ10296]|uniref:hypothetical protein n=1 Tax=Fodinicurvata sp. EGI_FJ10296 TaxID=3231908 RepID=UPI0034528903
MLTVRGIGARAALACVGALSMALASAAVYGQEAGGQERAANRQTDPEAVTMVAQDAAVRVIYGDPGPAENPLLDLTALRLYAVANRMDYVESEVRRLRSIDPNWVPPDDLFDPLALQEQVDETPIWDLHAAGRLHDAEGMITRLRVENPSWTPSEDLATIIRMDLKRIRLNAAYGIEQWETVLAVARGNTDLLACETVNEIWETAHSAAELAEVNTSFGLYEYVVINCDPGGPRFASVQKANEHLGLDYALPLIEIEDAQGYRRTVSEDAEWRRIRAEIIGEGIGVSELAEMTDEEIAALEAEILEERDIERALYLGWEYLTLQQYERSREWFQTAWDWGESADEWSERYVALRGIALTYEREGNFLEAVRFAMRILEEDPEAPDLFAGIMLRMLAEDAETAPLEEHIERFKELVIAREDAASAKAIGWFDYRGNRFSQAAIWFERALEWEEEEEAAEGLALSLLRSGDRSGFNAVVEEWRARSSAIRRLESETRVRAAAPAAPSGPPAAVTAFEAGRYSQCLDLSAGNPDLAEVRGWCLIELNRPTEAERAFATAISAGVGDAADLDLGLALSYLSRGMAGDAERVLQRGNLAADKRAEVRAEILARRATNAYSAQDYRTAIALIDERSLIAPARRDLLMLKGWALHNLNRRTDALELFSALDRQMSTTESQNAIRIVRSALN